MKAPAPSLSVRLFTLSLDTLATYRLTRLIVKDGITQGLRDQVAWHDEQRHRKPDYDAVQAEALWGEDVARVGPRTYVVNCSHCTGVWVAFAVTLARRLLPLPWHVVAQPLAVAAVVSLVSDRDSTA